MPRKELPPQYADWYRIADAAPAMNIAHAQYVRQLVREKFQFEDVVNPNTGQEEKGAIKLDMGSYKVWVINPTIVTDYHTRQTTRSGLRRYMVRFDANVITPDALGEAIRSIVAKAHNVKPGNLTDKQFTFAPAYRKRDKSIKEESEDGTGTEAKSVKATSAEGVDPTVTVHENVGGLD